MKKLFSMLLYGAMLISFVACENKTHDDFSLGNSSSFDTKEAVDLGLPSGTLWATCNVGAAKPEDFGNYFAWGETKPKESYGWFIEGDYKWGVYDDEDSNYGMTKYNPMDRNDILDDTDDAATVNWGKNWRMPTIEELGELVNYCTWRWTGNYNSTDVAGYIVYSKAEGNTNSIFLPAAGYCNGTELDDVGICGGYWSSSLSDYDYGYGAANARCLIPKMIYFHSGSYNQFYGQYRFIGCSVRPVCSPQ